MVCDRRRMWRILDHAAMRNLFYFLVGVLLAFCATLAMAASPVSGYRYETPNSGTIYSTPESACAVHPNWSLFQNKAVLLNTGHYQCQILVSGTWKPLATVFTLSASICADGSTPDTTKPTAQQCADPAPVCTAGTTLNVRIASGRRNDDVVNLPTNVDGCSVTVEEVVSCWSAEDDPSSNPNVFCTYRVKRTGDVYSGSDSVSSTSSGSDTKQESSKKFDPATGQGCPAGTVNIGTDSTGGSICAGSGTASPSTTKTETQQPSTTTTNSDGSTTKTEVSSRTNSDGSVTTTTTTTNTGADGKVTKTTSTSTTSASSGGGGKSDADTESDFCKKNPNLNVCKNSTVAGDCENTSCEGDAIQCAILRQQRKEYCENIADNALKTLGKQILEGNDPKAQAIADAFKGSEVDLSAQSLDQNGFAGGGQCFPDRSISVMGRTVAVSFSQVCNNIAALRFAIVACSLIAAYLLVNKSILQG